MGKQLKYKHFVETLLQIIEDKSNKNYFPIYIYYVLITVMYCQFAGYVFSTYETKPLVDPNIRYFAHIMEYSPGTFLLYVTANDTLTLMFFVIFEIFLYGYILYIIIMTFIRRYYKEVLHRFSSFFKIINYILQIFFSCFLWIFYVPFTEIHAGIAVCGDNSFLTSYRNADGCDKKPLYQIVLGVSGITLTFLTGCLLNYFYVSYEFEERNYLKRRFSWNLMIQMLARSLLISFYYLKIANITLVKHITSHTLGLTSCLDILINLPFRNKQVMLYYGTATFVYESSMILFSIWNLTNFLAEYNLFYFWCILMPLCFGLMYSYWNFAYFSLMRVNFKEMGRYYFIIDQYLEEISHLSENSESDKRSKLKLCGILKSHLQICTEPRCIFQKKSKYEKFLDDNFQININILTKIINNWFTIFINHDLFKKNLTNKEYLSLKYCSFLANYQDNPIRAYYELKTLLNKDKKKDEKSGNSLFFRLLAKIISKNIESLIMQQIRFERGIKISDEATKKQEFFYSASLYKLEKFKQKYINNIIEICQMKKNFWERLLGGFNSIDDYNKSASNLCRNMNKVNSEFNNDCKEFIKSKDKDNVIFLKISSIFNTVILNDILTSYKLERRILETKKRESLISKEFISSISIVKGNSITLIASLLNETGKILSKKDKKTAAFFNYNADDFENIDNISELMPNLTSKEHSFLISRYVEKGRSEYLQSSRMTFCKNYFGYIFPTKIFYNFIFDFMGNFGICAAVTKIETSSFFLILDDKGLITDISNNLTESLKIKDKTHLFAKSNYNILKLIPNLFDNVSISYEFHDKEGKDLKNVLLSNEKFWFYPPKCEIKAFLSNFSDFNNSKESKDFDFKKESHRNMFKNFLVNEDSKSNLRKVLGSVSVIHVLNFLSEGQYYSKFICEINEIYLNQMMDPDQSTGQRLTENLTETSKNILKQSGKDSEENSNPLNIISSQNMSIPIKNTLTISIPESKANQNQTPEQANFAHAIFEQAEMKKADESVAPISKDMEEFGYERNMTEIVNSQQKNENDPKKNEEESDEIEVKKSLSVEKESNNLNLEKRDISKEKFANELSVSSGSSLSTNYGSIFLKELVQGNHNPLIIKKIFVISIFQILFFFSINLVYIFLMNSRLNDFKVNIDGMEIPHYYMSSFTRMTVSLTYQYIENEGILMKNTSFLDPQNNLKKTAYENLINQMNSLKSPTYYYDAMKFEVEISVFIGESQKYMTLDFFEFINLIMENSFFVSQTTNLDNFTGEHFLFFVANYKKLFEINSNIENMFLNRANETKDSLISFYLILSIFGLTFAIFLQLINIPFFYKYYNLNEKILMTVARISESECIGEIKIYDNYINKMKSTTDEYLNYEFLAEEGKSSKKKKDFLQTSMPSSWKKNNSNYSSGYLSSRIMNQKLKKKGTNILNLLTIILVLIFFIVIFVFSSTIKNLLENSIELDKSISELSNSVDILKSLPNILLIRNYTNLKDRISPQIIQNISNLYENTFDSFNLIYTDLLNKFQYNGEIPEEYKHILGNLIIDDICEQIQNSYCKLERFNNFLYGFNGYFAVLIKQLRELNPYIFSEFQYDVSFIQQIFNQDNAYQNLIDDIIVFEARDKFLNIAKSAFDDQINKAFDNILLLFLLGGSGCCLALSFIFLALFYKIKMNFTNIRSILLMIPFKKLREDSTLYLLRNLQKY